MRLGMIGLGRMGGKTINQHPINQRTRLIRKRLIRLIRTPIIASD